MASNDPDELFRALGNLVINFAALEESLHDAIVLLAGPLKSTKVINVLTAGLPFRTLVEKFGALCVEAPRLRVGKEQVSNFCSRLNELNQRRNEYIHSAWMFRDPAQAPTRFKRSAKAKTGFSLNVVPAPVSEIHALAADLLEAELKLWEITP